MDGATLSQRLRVNQPELSVMLITGYTGITEQDDALPRLSNPFGMLELAQALTALIDADDRRSA